MTSSHHAPYGQGDTRTTMHGIARSKAATSSKSLKFMLSSDRGLQPAPVKLESLVNVDQHATLNTFSGLVHTARHTMGARNTRSR
jgi:hypothetical protein